MQDKVIVMKDDYTNCLNRLKNKNIKFDIIFLDPPYKADFAVKALIQILKLDLMQDDGIVVIETDEEERELKELEQIDICINNIRKYGRVKLMFLSRKG